MATKRNRTPLAFSRLNGNVVNLSCIKGLKEEAKYFVIGITSFAIFTLANSDANDSETRLSQTECFTTIAKKALQVLASAKSESGSMKLRKFCTTSGGKISNVDPLREVHC